MKKKILQMVESYVSKHGEDSIVSLLSDKINPDKKVLTIIANGGVHPLHHLHKRGDLFYASQGDLDFSSEESAEKEILASLAKVSKKLKSNNWETIYLVPFGPSPLSMAIKMLVYKVTYIETIDVLHLGSGEHVDIKIKTREVAFEKNS